MIFTISVLLAGLSYTTAKFLFNYNCIDICSEKEFYKCQNIVSPVIKDMAKNPHKNTPIKFKKIQLYL